MNVEVHPPVEPSVTSNELIAEQIVEQITNSLQQRSKPITFRQDEMNSLSRIVECALDRYLPKT